jgi:hypothetical protein
MSTHATLKVEPLASRITISVISIWRRKLCSPSTTPSGQSVTYVLGTFCYPCVRVGHLKFGSPRRTQILTRGWRISAEALSPWC